MNSSTPKTERQPSTQLRKAVFGGDLYYGDSPQVLREHIANASVDVIYLNPLFNPNRSYALVHAANVLATFVKPV